MTDIRDSQVVAKTLATNPADIRDSQVVAKTLATNPADIRDSQVVAKALVENPATIRDSQVVAKALVENPADIRDSQVLIKVLHSTAIAINLVAGTYTISGTDAALQRGLQLACDAGVYVINGTAASLERPNSLQADPGVYVITGTPVTLTVARTLSVVPGAYDVVGTSAGLPATRLAGTTQPFCQCCGNVSFCGCEDLPLQLIATFTNILFCGEVDGQTITLDWKPATQDYRGSATFCTPGVTFTARLWCNEFDLPVYGDCRDMRFDLDASDPVCEWSNSWSAEPGCTCDPLFMEFEQSLTPPLPPLECSCCVDDDITPGKWRVTITV